MFILGFCIWLCCNVNVDISILTPTITSNCKQKKILVCLDRPCLLIDLVTCLKGNCKFKRVLSISLTSSRQNCNLTKDFTFISSQHVSSSSLLFTWWFKNDRQYFPKNKRCRNPLSPESESGDKRLVIWVLKI